MPVIAYSGTPQAVESLARHGFNGILAKPCGDQELEDCLVRWCPSHRTAPALRDAAPDNSQRWQHARPAAWCLTRDETVAVTPGSR